MYANPTNSTSIACRIIMAFQEEVLSTARAEEGRKGEEEGEGEEGGGREEGGGYKKETGKEKEMEIRGQIRLIRLFI